MSVGAVSQKHLMKIIPLGRTEFIELYTALSPEEYESARASTLTAFYTPPVVISSIYKAMEQMGFRGGQYLRAFLRNRQLYRYAAPINAGQQNLRRGD